MKSHHSDKGNRKCTIADKSHRWGIENPLLQIGDSKPHHVRKGNRKFIIADKGIEISPFQMRGI